MQNMKTRFIAISEVRPRLYPADIIVDRITGVNYLMVEGGITPLLDTDGKPIVTKVVFDEKW